MTPFAEWLNVTFESFDYAILKFFHSLALSAGEILTPVAELFGFLGELSWFTVVIALVLLLFAKTRKGGVAMIFSVLFFKERFSKIKLLSLLLVLGGSVLVSGAFGGGEGFKFNLVGMIFAILSGLTLAGYNIFTKISSANGTKVLTVTLYGFLFMVLSSICVANPIEIALKASSAPQSTLPLLLGIGLVTCVSPYFLYNLAVDKIPVGTAAALAVIDPMASTVFSVFIGESLTVFSSIGVALVLCAIVLLYHRNNILLIDLLQTLGVGRTLDSARSGVHCVGITAVHHNNHRLCLALGDEVIHDEVHATLQAPTALVLAHTVQ